MSFGPIEKYRAMYNRNSNSPVYAPLADSYRRVGDLKMAMQILKNGLEIFPGDIKGKVVLAKCWVDCENFEKAYDTLSPYLEKSSLNLSFLNTFFEICEALDKTEESSDVLEKIVFLSPGSKWALDKLTELRTPSNLSSGEFTQEVEKSREIDDQEINESWKCVSIFEDENLVCPGQRVIDTPLEKNTPLKLNLPEVTSFDQPEEAGEEDLQNSEIMSLSLIRIYFDQGLTDQAIDLLDQYEHLKGTSEKSVELRELVNSKTSRVLSKKESRSKKLENRMLSDAVIKGQKKLAQIKGPDKKKKLQELLESFSSFYSSQL